MSHLSAGNVSVLVPQWTTDVFYSCFPLLLYLGAVHRYYESRRRLYNDNKPGRQEAAKTAKVTARKKERLMLLCTFLFHLS